MFVVSESVKSCIWAGDCKDWPYWVSLSTELWLLKIAALLKQDLLYFGCNRIHGHPIVLQFFGRQNKNIPSSTTHMTGHLMCDFFKINHILDMLKGFKYI